MKKWILPVSVVCLMVLSILGGDAFSDMQIGIAISPRTLVLKSDGEWVTVHADIAFGEVDRNSLTLEGVAVSWTKADAQGNLVAKFLESDIKDKVAPPQATLVFAGVTKAGERFEGSDTIQVRE